MNRLFGLGDGDHPGPSVFAWAAGSPLVPDGAPVEIRVAPGGDPPAAAR